jgi:hypothetical protein
MRFAVAVSPIILGALTAAAVGVSIVGTIVSTSAQVNAANYQAQVADRNAQIMQENANRAIFRSQQEQLDQDRKAAYAYGALTASQSASGLSLGGASFMLSRKNARQLGRIDALNVRQAGQLEAYNYLTQSEDSAKAAGFARDQANSSLLAGFLEGAGSLIGGAGSIYSKGYFSPTVGSAWRGGWGSGALA